VLSFLSVDNSDEVMTSIHEPFLLLLKTVLPKRLLRTLLQGGDEEQMKPRTDLWRACVSLPGGEWPVFFHYFVDMYRVL
jgi:hypothetical protein